MYKRQASCSLACPVPQSTTSLGLPAAALPQVLPAQLPISTPPTGLDECFFFISLVVGLPYSSVSCQFWLFFVLKLLLSFFWLWDEAQCVYVRLHLGRKPVLLFLTYKEPWGMCGQHLHTEWGPISPAGSSFWLLIQALIPALSGPQPSHIWAANLSCSAVWAQASDPLGTI